MDSEPEDCSSSSKDLELMVEMNGEVQKNGNHTVAAQDSLPSKDNAKSETSSSDAVKKADTAVAKSEPDKEETEPKSDTNGVKPVPQRRMSLRTRSTPKKFVDDSSSDEDPLAARDPLEIPLGKTSSTVLIRRSPTAAVKSPTSIKHPVKPQSKVTRPPPELIKAPHKISISPATSVTVVPRTKENISTNSGFVVVDTQSILKGKGNTVPASVTVSAVPQLPKAVPKPTPTPPAAAAAPVQRKTSAPNSTSLPDPFESLGLADDSFIVEAPSFVVPYLIEKMAPENLKKIVTSLQPEKKEDLVELSEDEDSSDSEKKGKEESKSSMKSEMEKSSKSETNKEEEDYFTGPIGRFFLDIGLSLVQEYVQGDLLRVQKRKVHKGTKIADPSLSVNALSKGLDVTRAKNEPYRLPWRSCDRCNFKSESKLVLCHHWSQPLAIGYGPTARHGCHWCPFEAKETHLEKRFIADRNLEPPLDWEPPAKIPRMPTRGLRAFAGGVNPLQGYTTKGLNLPYHPLLPKSAILGYNNVLASAGSGQNAFKSSSKPSQAALGGLRLPAELHVVPGSGQRVSTGASQAKANYRNQAYLNPPPYGVPNNQIYQAIAKSFQLLHGQGSSMSVTAKPTNAMDKLRRTSSGNAISLVPGLVNTSGLTIQSSSTPTVTKVKNNQQPSISITPLPRAAPAAAPGTNKSSLSVSPVTPSAANIGNNALTTKAGQAGMPGQKGAVVCEICDGSIKDLEQLRHHMQWIHKVKIHPKMIHNRPPLNCQKCQCRFFTDQGLERHLLGSHGLVTSSMQEAANRGQDGGRCPICGKVHQWKLLSHVVKDHGLSLKPAHLSYKCTVCTATFTMYKLFENHVYTAHSVVARKVLDKDKVEMKKGSSTTNATLRINDEITIIPQSARHDSADQNACRPSKRSRVDVIDLSDDEDNRSLPKSQVTITKVPAPKGYKSSRESMSKRSRTDDNDTE